MVTWLWRNRRLPDSVIPNVLICLSSASTLTSEWTRVQRQVWGLDIGTDPVQVFPSWKHLLGPADRRWSQPVTLANQETGGWLKPWKKLPRWRKSPPKAAGRKCPGWAQRCWQAKKVAAVVLAEGKRLVSERLWRMTFGRPHSFQRRVNDKYFGCCHQTVLCKQFKQVPFYVGWL